MRQNRSSPLLMAGVAVFLLFCGGMLVGTWFDLEIDKALFSYSCGWAQFLERFGSFPAQFVRPLACSALLSTFRDPSRALDALGRELPVIRRICSAETLRRCCVILYCFLYGALFFAAFYGVHQGIVFFFPGAMAFRDLLTLTGRDFLLSGALWGLVRLVPVLLAVLLLRRLPREILSHVVKLAVAGLLVEFSYPVIELLKHLFHRVRFREMIAYSHGLVNGKGWSSIGGADLPRAWIADADFSAFTPWYRFGNPMGRYSAATSFPSGHTAAAAYSLLLIPLFAGEQTLRSHTVFAVAVSVGYTALVGVSRLVRGAHYLTDVCGAALILFSIILLWYWIVCRIFSALKNRRERCPAPMISGAEHR